jgi:DNA-binding protein WhiA
VHLPRWGGVLVKERKREAMSFSNEVRAEVRKTITDRDKQFACLYGMLLYCRVFTKQQIVLQSESAVVGALVPALFHAVFGVSLAPDERGREGSAGALYSFTITDPLLMGKIQETYQIDPLQREINLRNLVNNSMHTFLAGVFLICGSVIDPNKEYHLEFVTPSALLCSDLNQILETFGVTGHEIVRKKSYVLYMKDSECIEDTLTFMGAQQCTLSLMNIKIHKDMRNKANRVRNCDAANIDKVVSAAMKQTEDIRLLMACGQLDNLSPELREVALLRLENPELSLKEIGELLTVPIGRSGVNHRFQKIAALAKELREHAGKTPAV